MPVQGVPGGRPKPSPMAARIRGSGLHDDVHRRIGDGLPHAARTALFEKGRGGADVDALPALDADRFVHLRGVGGGDVGLEAAALLAEVVNALDFAADADAAAAEHALLPVADDRMAGKVDRNFLPPALEVPCPHAHRIGQVLEFAVAVAVASLAILGVVVQQQFDDVAAGLADVGRVGLHLHAFPHLLTTGSHIKTHAFDVDDANSAGALQAEVGMVAEPGDADAQLLAGLHDGRAIGNLEGSGVDGEGDLFLEHFVVTVPADHAPRQ